MWCSKFAILLLAGAFALGGIITDLWSRPHLESNEFNITLLFIHFTFYVFAKLCSSQDCNGICLENCELFAITWLQLHRFYTRMLPITRTIEVRDKLRKTFFHFIFIISVYKWIIKFMIFLLKSLWLIF